MRKTDLFRKTAETDVKISLNIDGKGESKIDSGCGFIDHMLTLFSLHGKFDLEVKCVGDTKVDYHHSVEDIGIVLGEAFKKCLGDKVGINRYGDNFLSMDESLVLTSVDFSGRTFLGYFVEGLKDKVGDFDTELVEEFWYGFVRKAECTLHVRKIAGENTHHIIEGIFKSVARALRQAVQIDDKFKKELPSTKGVL